MLEDSCALLRCNNPFHDHTPDDAGLPELAKLLDAQDPAFDSIVKLLVDMRSAGIAATPESVRVAIKLGRLYHSATPVEPPAELADGLRYEVVYYMRFGNLIKIGTTGLLHVRIRQLKPDDLLATEPGSYPLETKRHRQFARYRAEGELFYPAPSLMDHIRKVRGRRRRSKPRPAVMPRSGRPVAKLGEHLF